MLRSLITDVLLMQKLSDMAELNNSLIPKDSPLAQSGQVSPFEWDATNERGVINATKIKNFSFNSGTGGTLTLGGTENGSGYMQLKDENGTAIFSADYEGHHYYGTAGTVEQIRVDDLGFHAYGTSGTAQELIRVDDQGFHAYGTSGTAQELVKVDDTGFHAYNSGGTEQFKISSEGLFAYGNSNIVQRFRSDASSTISYGAIGFSQSDNAFAISALGGYDFYLLGSEDKGGVLGVDDTLLIHAGTQLAFKKDSNNQYLFYDAAGTTYRTLTMDSNKTAIVETSKGFNALYCMESPEVWFMDFCESKDKIDPLFLEVTTPPYHFIKCEDGEYQVWGKRKGHEKLRFEKKTKSEADENNRFWAMPGLRARSNETPELNYLLKKSLDIDKTKQKEES